MNTMTRRFLASFVLVAALLVGSTAQAGVTVTISGVDAWSTRVQIGWEAGDRTHRKEFEEDETTPDGFESLQEAAKHIKDGGSATVEWSLNEDGLYEVDVTLS